MQQADDASSLLRKALHAYFDGIMKEPLPERWVDLINRLNEEERRSRHEPPNREPH